MRDILIFGRAVFVLIVLIVIQSQTCAQQLTIEGENKSKVSKFGVSATAVSPDGKYLVKTYGLYAMLGKNQKSVIQIFDAKTMKLKKVLTAHENLVGGIKFSPDGKYMVSVGAEVFKWKVESWEIVARYGYEKGGATGSIDFSSDGLELLLCSFRGVSWYANVFDFDNLKLTKEFKIKGMQFYYHPLRFFQDRYVISGRASPTKGHFVYVYDKETGKTVFDNADQNYGITKGLNPNEELWMTKTNPPVDILKPETWEIEVKKYTFNGKDFIEGSSVISEKLGYEAETKIVRGVRDMIVSKKTGWIFVADAKDLMIYDQNGRWKKTVSIISRDVGALTNEITGLFFINDENHVLVADSRNVSHFIDIKQQKEVASLYSSLENENGHIVVSTDGRMDGDIETAESLYWNNGSKRIPLAATFDQMYTPNLGMLIFADELNVENNNLEAMVQFAPEVQIVRPDSVTSVTKNLLPISIKGKENGDPIKGFNVYVNDKLVNDGARGFRKMGLSYDIDVKLIQGQNIIKVVSVSEAGYQSAPDKIVVNYEGKIDKSDLYILTIGINQYKNPVFNLNYAIADSRAISSSLKVGAENIFDQVNITNIENTEGIKLEVKQAFESIADQAKPQDVFFFYYAGHGVMAEATPEIPSDFYLALHDVTQMYGREDLLNEKGVSAVELREWSSNISAQKQIMILDACQSGGAVETFAKRGAAEQKAMMQLARSSGTILLASTGSEQYAMEFEKLGHGVFTYALLEGLSGKADNGDQKITAKEIEVYLNEQIPVLTEEHKGQAQYPMSWSRGQDFPLVIGQ